MPEEVRLWLRTAGFGLAIAVVYWFVSYEIAGTLLLVGFGLGGAFLAVFSATSLRRAGHHVQGPPWTWIGLASPDAPNVLTDEESRLPSASFAPLAIGLAIAIAALGLVYGLWLVVAALPLLAIGARAWYREASAEHRAVERSRTTDRPG
jgi:hypothetical protein